jgi:intracellular septation protein
MRSKATLNPVLKLALDLGPLLFFMLVYFRPALFAPLLTPLLPPALMTGEHAPLYAATTLFIPAVVLALAVSYGLTRRLPLMPVVTAVVVIVFGGLTLYLQNEMFIKLKPTIIYALFSGILFAGLAFRKPLLGMVLDAAFHLTDEGWRILTLRWAFFFLVLAILNEIVRNFASDSVWVSFKFFGVLPLTILFGALQVPLMMKHEAPQEAEAEE